MPPSCAFASKSPVMSFNPHPARRPDATAADYQYPAALYVSILIRPEGRMPPPIIFNGISLTAVSILIRPEGRMPPKQRSIATWPLQFQSSSGPKAGCHALMPTNSANYPCFNPHPARRPDATSMLSRVVPPELLFQSSSGPKAGCHKNLQQIIMRVRVSILIRPEGRMPHRLEYRYIPRDEVSILIRPEGRMPHASTTPR